MNQIFSRNNAVDVRLSNCIKLRFVFRSVLFSFDVGQTQLFNLRRRDEKHTNNIIVLSQM